MITCNNNEAFLPGYNVTSLVNRPPSIQVGTEARILNRWVGTLYAVKMPNGDLYRWLSNQDVRSVDLSQPNLKIGDMAVVELSNYSHFYHPELENGVAVEIIKIIKTDYYEVGVAGAGNYGWFAGFELSTVF